jgi:hypothetical protein
MGTEHQVRQLVTSWYYGKTTTNEELSLPFLFEAVSGLIEDGFEEQSQLPIDVISPQRTQPTAIFGVDDVALIGIAAFMGTSVGSWSIGRVCDDLWDKKIKPAVRNLYRRRKKNGLDGQGVTLSFGVWFDVDQVFVQVIAALEPGQDSKAVEDLVPEAFRRAETWIKEHGVQAPVLVYRIRSGEVSSVPTLAQEVPKQ